MYKCAASAPGSARLTSLQEKVTEYQIICAFAELLYSKFLVKTAIERAGASIHEPDPTCVAINSNARQYTQLLRALVDGIQTWANRWKKA